MSKAIDVVVKNDFSFSQAKVIIAKLKEQWGQIKSWSVPQLQKLGKLLKDLNVEDLKFLSKEQFQVQGLFKFYLLGSLSGNNLSTCWELPTFLSEAWRKISLSDLCIILTGY